VSTPAEVAAASGFPVAGTMLSRWEGLLERHGTRAVFIARLLPLARTFVSLPAGARRVPLIPFIALTTIGSLWAVGFVLTGVIAASAWATVDSAIGCGLLAYGLLALVLSVMRRR
jgi:membrane protein DedA with SNARE-associated domain